MHPDPLFIVDSVTGAALHKKRTISASLISVLEQLTDNVVDCVAALFSLPVPKDVNQDVSPQMLS